MDGSPPLQVATGFPKQPVPRDDDAADQLKRRTLTRLYNARPQWLDDAHAERDAAVAAAYGWKDGIDEQQALRRLMELGGSARTPIAATGAAHHVACASRITQPRFGN